MKTAYSNDLTGQQSGGRGNTVHKSIAKRLLAVLLAMVIILPMMAVVNVSAADTSAQNFVIYYDENLQGHILYGDAADKYKEEHGLQVAAPTYGAIDYDPLDIAEETFDNDATLGSHPRFDNANEVAEYVLKNSLNEEFVSTFYYPKAKSYPWVQIMNCVYTYFPHLFVSNPVGDVSDTADSKTIKVVLTMSMNANQKAILAEEEKLVEDFITKYPFMSDGHEDYEDGMIDFDTEKQYINFVHDYICRTMDYDYNGVSGGTSVKASDYDYAILPHEAHGQFTYCALAEHWGVCNTYASALSMICLSQGIDVPHVVGDANPGSSHAWNVVYTDEDTLRMVDVTWDDIYSTKRENDKSSWGNAAAKAAGRRPIELTDDYYSDGGYYDGYGYIDTNLGGEFTQTYAWVNYANYKQVTGLSKRKARPGVMEFLAYLHGDVNFTDRDLTADPDAIDVASLMDSAGSVFDTQPNDADIEPKTEGTVQTATGFALTFERAGAFTPVTVANYDTDVADSRLVLWKNGGKALNANGVTAVNNAVQLKAYLLEMTALGSAGNDFPMLLANSGYNVEGQFGLQRFYDYATAKNTLWITTSDGVTLDEIAAQLKTNGKYANPKNTIVPKVSKGKLTVNKSSALDKTDTVWFFQTHKPVVATDGKLAIREVDGLPVYGKATITTKVAPSSLYAYKVPAATALGQAAGIATGDQESGGKTYGNVYDAAKVKAYKVTSVNVSPGFVSDPIFIAPRTSAPTTKNANPEQPSLDATYTVYVDQTKATTSNGLVAILPADSDLDDFKAAEWKKADSVKGSDIDDHAIFILGGPFQYNSKNAVVATTAKVVIVCNQSGKSTTVTAKIVNAMTGVNNDGMNFELSESDDKYGTLVNKDDGSLEWKDIQKPEGSAAAGYYFYTATATVSLYASKPDDSPWIRTATGDKPTTNPTVFMTKTQPTAANWSTFINSKGKVACPSGTQGTMLKYGISSDKMSVYMTNKWEWSGQTPVMVTGTEYLVISYGTEFADNVIVPVMVSVKTS
jgi:hypothetical protein